MSAVDAPADYGRVTPFGVRFVDDVNGRVVSDGLRVVAWPSDEPSRKRAARLNASNVFYLLDAAGMRDLELGSGDDAYWQALPRRREFTFDVDDSQGRFQPFRFPALLPARGLFRLHYGSPPTPVPLPPGAEGDGVPLFTAPARPKSPGCVVLRADLWDAEGGRPAAWAVLEARTPGARQRGEAPRRAIADARGSVALHFPIPDEVDFEGGSFESPIGGVTAPFAARTWTVELQASYGRLARAADTDRRVTPPIPDLGACLTQPPARLWDALGGAPRELTEFTVQFGHQALLKSSDAGSAPAAVLLLTQSQSPP